jgi:hypothetical protein
MPPISGRRLDILSATSVAGVMGYPAKKVHPAAKAPSALASSPFKKCSPVSNALSFMEVVLSSLLHQRIVSRDVLLAESLGELEGAVDGEFRTDNLTEIAVHTLRLLARNGFGGMVSLDIVFCGQDQHPIGTEFDAVATPLASICDDVQFSHGDGVLVGVQGKPPKLHSPPLRKLERIPFFRNCCQAPWKNRKFGRRNALQESSWRKHQGMASLSLESLPADLRRGLRYSSAKDSTPAVLR